MNKICNYYIYKKMCDWYHDAQEFHLLIMLQNH